MSGSLDHHQFRVGDIVTDRDDSNPSPAVVIQTLDATATDVIIEATGTTVAAENPSYPRDASTVTVAFESTLDDHVHGWEVSTAESLWEYVQSKNINTYTYPEPRLEPTGENKIRHRTTDDGLQYIHRLHVTTVGDTLVIGKDFDGVDHGAGVSRKVCFHNPDIDIQEDNVVHVEYGYEKPDIDDIPPLLADIEQVRVIQQTAGPDFLLDL